MLVKLKPLCCIYYTCVNVILLLPITSGYICITLHGKIVELLMQGNSYQYVNTFIFTSYVNFKTYHI